MLLVGGLLGFLFVFFAVGGVLELMRGHGHFGAFVGSILLSVALLLMAVVLVPRGGYHSYFGQASASWPVASAQVVRSEIEWVRRRSRGRSGGHHEVPVPRLVYRFEHEGRSYEGGRIAWSASNGFPGTSYATDLRRGEAMVAAFPKGSTIDVAYDPGDPHQAVVRAGLQAWAFAELVVGSALGLSGLLSLGLVGFDPRTRELLEVFDG